MKYFLTILYTVTIVNLNCITRYQGMPSQSIFREIACQTLFIQINYNNLNPKIDSFEMEPKIDKNLVEEIARQNKISNIIIVDNIVSGNIALRESDLKLEINLNFYPTKQNVSVLFLIPTSSKLEFQFLLFDFEDNLIDSQIISRENMYFILLFPLAPFFYDDDADERILNDYFGNFLLAKEF